MRADGKIGENFVLAKISAYTVFALLYSVDNWTTLTRTELENAYITY